MNRELIRDVAAQVQIFRDINQKENFLFVLGALLARVISLQKAAEIMEMEPDTFLKVLDLIGIEFSYLSEEDVAIERDW